MIARALLAFALAGLALAWLDDRVHRHAYPELASAWIDHFALPLCRAFVLLLFVLSAYPDLYALRHAPPLQHVLFTVPGRFDSMINALFVAGLVAPALPVLRRIPGLTLPLQGMAGIALLFSWIAASLGEDASAMPTPAQWLSLATMAGAATGLAQLLALAVRDPVAREDVRDLALLWLQAPILIVYARMIGARLAG